MAGARGNGVGRVGAFYGLMAALGWGCADFLGTIVTRRAGVLRALFAIQIAGTAGLGLLLLVIREPPPGWTGHGHWGWPALFAVAAVNVVAMAMLYRSFALGSLSIVSPIASSYTVMLALFAFFAGERVPRLALAGTALLVLGVTIVARSAPSAGAGVKAHAGVPEAIGAAVMMALSFGGLDRLTAELGWLWTVIGLRLTQLAIFGLAVAAARLRNGRAEPFPRALIPFAIGMGVMDTVGLIGFNLGVEHAYATTTGALSSLYAAVAVLLAWIFLRERLPPPQIAGVSVILAGVLLVSL